MDQIHQSAANMGSSELRAILTSRGIRCQSMNRRLLIINVDRILAQSAPTVLREPINPAIVPPSLPVIKPQPIAPIHQVQQRIPVIIHVPRDLVVGPPAYVVFDLETTGLSQDSRISEIAAALYALPPSRDAPPIAEFTTVIDLVPDDYEKSAHHGIHLREAFDEFARIVSCAKIIVGHNIKGFDIPIIKREAARIGGHPIATIASRITIHDTLSLARSLHSTSRKLQHIYSCVADDAREIVQHRALPDVRMTNACYVALISPSDELITRLRQPLTIICNLREYAMLQFETLPVIVGGSMLIRREARIHRLLGVTFFEYIAQHVWARLRGVPFGLLPRQLYGGVNSKYYPIVCRAEKANTEQCLEEIAMIAGLKGGVSGLTCERVAQFVQEISPQFPAICEQIIEPLRQFFLSQFDSDPILDPSLENAKFGLHVDAIVDDILVIMPSWNGSPITDDHIRKMCACAQHMRGHNGRVLHKIGILDLASGYYHCADISAVPAIRSVPESLGDRVLE